jgi:trimethylamine corrinoid protein
MTTVCFEKENYMETSELYSKMSNAVIEGDKDAAVEAAREVLKMSVNPREAIEMGFTPGIKKMGDLWEEGEVFLPELVLAAEAMKAGIDVLAPELARQNQAAPTMGTMVIGTIQGDIHDIGKSLVASLFSASGYKVIDLGVDVPPERFIEEAKANNANVIGMSALLTTTMIGQKKVIDLLKAQGIRNKFRILVGGAPVSKKWAEEIGADGAPAGAMEAVQAARNFASVHQG